MGIMIRKCHGSEIQFLGYVYISEVPPYEGD